MRTFRDSLKLAEEKLMPYRSLPLYRLDNLSECVATNTPEVLLEDRRVEALPAAQLQ